MRGVSAMMGVVRVGMARMGAERRSVWVSHDGKREM